MHVYVNERVSKRIVRLQHGVAVFKHILGILVDLYSAILHISLCITGYSCTAWLAISHACQLEALTDVAVLGNLQWQSFEVVENLKLICLPLLHRKQ